MPDCYETSLGATVAQRLVADCERIVAPSTQTRSFGATILRTGKTPDRANDEDHAELLRKPIRLRDLEAER